MKVSSNITFLYFRDLVFADGFFGDTLGLEKVMDKDWVKIWRTGESGFVGGVDAERGSVEASYRGGLLVSFNVDNVAFWHDRLKDSKDVKSLTDIKENPEISLKSFFFEGPGGYSFEVQEFLNPKDREIFLS